MPCGTPSITPDLIFNKCSSSCFSCFSRMGKIVKLSANFSRFFCNSRIFALTSPCSFRTSLLGNALLKATLFLVASSNCLSMLFISLKSKALCTEACIILFLFTFSASNAFISFCISVTFPLALGLAAKLAAL